MIKYNEDFEIYVSDTGELFNKDMVKYNYTKPRNSDGYVQFDGRKRKCKKCILVHRLVWQTFNGDIPEGMQIDHIDRDRGNNKLSNLRLVTPSENAHNTNRHQKSEFGLKYEKHFGITCTENKKQYNTEHCFYRRHGYCRWESKNY